MNLLEALKKIRDDGPVSTKYGICGNVIDLANVKECKKLDILFLRWPRNKGRTNMMRTSYPVEGHGVGYKRSVEAGELWDNPRRHELLNWLIKELENG